LEKKKDRKRKVYRRKKKVQGFPERGSKRKESTRGRGVEEYEKGGKNLEINI